LRASTNAHSRSPAAVVTVVAVVLLVLEVLEVLVASTWLL